MLKDKNQEIDEKRCSNCIHSTAWPVDIHKPFHMRRMVWCGLDEDNHRIGTPVPQDHHCSCFKLNTRSNYSL